MKKIVITGAADGIGKALATAFIEEGHCVTGVDVDQQRADKTRSELGENMRFIMADLTQHHILGQVAQQIGNEVDIVIHNAGISAVGYFKTSDITAQQRVIDINLTAPIILTKHLLANKQLTDDASLVFISSLSHYVSYPGASVYGATKTGLAAYARTLSVAYSALHIMTVYPGPTRTAHARRYSPDNSREDKRMSPSELADQIIASIESRQRILIPGVGNWIFAILGRLVPSLTDFAMKKAILRKFDP